MTFTTENRKALEAYLQTHSLPSGIGSEESACTVAAINLAISGELTDNIPDCMSEVLGKAAIRLQDAMPDEMRNSRRYKTLIPKMAGTGRELEKERLEVLMEWMWFTVIPTVQPIADKNGFGKEWSAMCEERSIKASYTAADAAYAAARAAARAAYAANAAYSSGAAVDAAAAYAADDIARAAAAADSARAARAAEAAYAAYAAGAADYAARAVYSAAACAAVDAADDADDVARAAAADSAPNDFWTVVDPIGVLERMTYLDKGK